MAINFAPGPAENPLAALAALMTKNNSGGAQDDDIALAVQKAYLGQFLPGVGDTSPVQSWTQGAGRMMNGALTGLIVKRLMDTGAARDKERSAAMSNLPGLGPDTSSAVAPTPVAPTQKPVSDNTPALTPNMLAMTMVNAAGDQKPAPMAQPPMPASPGPEPLAPSAVPTPQARPQQVIPPGILSPTAMADQSAPLTGGNPAQGVDRSRIKSELDANPALLRKYADMTFGEVRGQGPKAAQIEAETAADRALARGIPLSQALMAVNDPNARRGGKNLGYYASDTYSRPANPQEFAQFQNDILPKVKGGSELGMQTFGFRPTGNASGSFAATRAANGMYDNSAWLSGQAGKGEMFATEPGDTARMAKNLKSNFPAELLNPNMDVGNSFALTQVAGDNIVPQAPQGPAVGQFTPGSLPSVPNVAVRPTGPQAVSPQQAQPAMPQAAQVTPQTKTMFDMPPAVKAWVSQNIKSRDPVLRQKAFEIYQQYAKPVTPKYHPIGDNALYEEISGTVKSVDVNKKTNEIRDYERYAEQTKASGGQPIPFKDYQLELKRAGATAITNDMRGENAFSAAAARYQTERFNKIIETGFAAKSMRADMQTLRDLGQRIGTGKEAEIKAALGPYAQMVGINIDGLGEMQAYKSIVSKLAPRMRPPGSGATSDYEFQQYLESLPGLGKTPEGNLIIEQTQEALQNHQEVAADIASRAMNKEISPREADKMLRELDDPLTAWKKFKKQGLGSAPAAAPGQGSPSIDDLVKKYSR